MKHICILYRAVLCAFVAGISCSCIHELEGDGVASYSVTASLKSHETKVSLSKEEGESLDLIAAWREGDQVRPIINNGRYIQLDKVTVRDITNGGGQASFMYDVDASVFIPSTGYELLCFTDASNATVHDDEIYINASLMRSVLSKFDAPMYAVASVAERNDIHLHFDHYMTYELLHVKNTTASEITFCLNDIRSSDGSVWYKTTGAINYRTRAFEINSGAALTPVTSSGSVVIPSGESETFISSYIPIGNNISNATLYAEVDGEATISSNTKSSDVELQTSHAYHMYAEWDGYELKFVEPFGDEEEVDPDIPTNGDLIIERDFYVHPENDNFYGSLSIVFNDGQGWEIQYRNDRYTKGVLLKSNHTNYEKVADLEFDTWNKERIVIDEEGELSYYLNDNYVGSIVDTLLITSEKRYFNVVINPSGWFTGHYQYTDNLKIKYNEMLIKDNFNGGYINPKLWADSENGETGFVEDGVLKVIQSAEDKDNTIKTQAISLAASTFDMTPPSEDIVIERDRYVHGANDQFFASLSVNFESGKTWQIRYDDYRYGYTHGIYLHSVGPKTFVHRVSDLQQDEWVHEKIVISKEGVLIYYMNGKLIGSITKSQMKVSDDEKYFITISPSGWYTGHYHYTDNLNMTTSHYVIVDDFEGDSLNMDVWAQPKYPDSAFVESGMLKTILNREGADCSISTKIFNFKLSD